MSSSTVLDPEPEVLVLRPPANSPVDMVPDESRSPVPTLLNDRFEVLLWLGDSERTSDFVGYDRLHQQNVVVRVLSKNFVADPVVRRRIGELFSKIHSLGHNALVELVDWGSCKLTVGVDPVFFVVTRPPDGPTLGRLIDQRGPIPAHQAMALRLSADDLLNDLSNQGLKPSKIEIDRLWLTPNRQIRVDPVDLVLDIATLDAARLIAPDLTTKVGRPIANTKGSIDGSASTSATPPKVPASSSVTNPNTIPKGRVDHTGSTFSAATKVLTSTSNRNSSTNLGATCKSKKLAANPIRRTTRSPATSPPTNPTTSETRKRPKNLTASSAKPTNKPTTKNPTKRPTTKPAANPATNRRNREYKHPIDDSGTIRTQSKIQGRTRARSKAIKRVRSFAIPLASVVLLAISWMSMAPPKWGGQLTFTVVSGTSMEPAFHTGDLVVLRRSGHYQTGDIVTYSVPEKPYTSFNVVHRIVKELPDGRFVIRGDNRDADDPWLVSNADIRGKQILLVAKGGFVLLFFSTPVGFALMFGVLVTAWLWGSPMLRGSHN